MNTRDQLWARVYADALQRKEVWFKAAEEADTAVKAFDRRAALATKPQAEQEATPPAQEQDAEQAADYRWLAQALKGGV